MTGKPGGLSDVRPTAAATGVGPKPSQGQGGLTPDAPARKPSGSMVYTVQKGANIVPSWRKG